MTSTKCVKIGEGEWVVVCDGSKALFLQNAGDSKFPNLQTREVLEQKVLSNQRDRHRCTGPLPFFRRLWSLVGGADRFSHPAGG